MRSLQDRALFWLDGHYSGGHTARGKQDTPIRQELRIIFGHRIKGHVILIDDARLFVGADGYPTLDELRRIVQTARPEWGVAVTDDVIRIAPTGS